MILVTGSAGQIGSYVLESFENAYGVDLKPFKDLPILIGDLRDYEFVKRVVKDADIVIHLAAQVSVEKSWKDPVFDLENNVIATINLLRASLDFGVEKFVYFSSAAVYGNPVYLPIDEEHQKNPISPYGVSKLFAEQYCRLFSDKIDILILRPFNVFSERMNAEDPYSGVIAKFIARAKKKQPLVIYGDGKQTRDFVHVKDVLKALKIVLKRGKSGEAYNVGTGKETSILELAKLVNELSGNEGIVFEKPREGDIKRSYADISKLRALGFEPETDLRRDLEKLLNL
ncbi:MAG: NAD-dependent epimerase/dehydratase family protein [Archaeoglobaceae archaeon]